MPKIISSILNIAKDWILKSSSESDNYDEVIAPEVAMPPGLALEDLLTPELLKKNIFIYTPLKDIQANLPIIISALKSDNMFDVEMVCYAIATLFVENDKFKPIAESPSKYSTKSGQPPYDFSNYLHKGGNTTLEECSKYRGSGFIQLTLKDNYAHWDKKLNLDGGLVEGGYIAANEPHIAAFIFSGFLKEREDDIRAALDLKDFKKARTYVNGHAALHWEKLKDCYIKLEQLLS